MPTVAYVSNMASFIDGYAKIVERTGASLMFVNDVLEVREKLLKQKVDLILTSLDLAVSSSEKEVPNEPELKALEDTIQKSGFWNGGLYAIKLIRKDGSANKKTPIIVADLYNHVGDPLLPDAEKRALEAGATAYYDDPRPVTLRELILKNLPKQ